MGNRQGSLKLIAAIYEASPLRELSKRSKRMASPAYRCNVAIFRLVTIDSAVERMRAHNALEGFRQHKRTINSAEPGGASLGMLRTQTARSEAFHEPRVFCCELEAGGRTDQRKLLDARCMLVESVRGRPRARRWEGV